MRVPAMQSSSHVRAHVGDGTKLSKLGHAKLWRSRNEEVLSRSTKELTPI